VGLITIAITGIPCLVTGPVTLPWLAGLIAFGVLFFYTSRFCGDERLRVALLVAQSLIALGLISHDPERLMPILLIIVAAQAGAHFSAVVVGLWIVVQTAGLSLVAWMLHFQSIWISALAYGMFQIFAAVTTHIADSETEARRELARANAELRVATELLGVSSRVAERLRIARDLHDLIGHHLTALSLNLEVASHLATGDAAESIAKSKELTRQLLADVRRVVSRLREDEPIDLGHALAAMRDVVGTPRIHVELPPELAILDSAVAHVALRCVQEIVTNAVKHSEGRNLWLRVARDGGELVIDARDDGVGAPAVRAGNGLRGLRERVEAMRGRVEFTTRPGEGFAVHAALPLEGAAA
jgi:signal transduction histidine kinase